MGRSWTGNRRAPWQDYTKRRIYLITLMKCAGVMPFGELAGDWQLPRGSYGRSYIKASPLGYIVKGCLREIGSIHPALRVYQYALMPDHLHILLSVEDTLDEILGRKLAAFKVMVNNRANLERVFERGFNDQVLTPSRNLDVIYDYLNDNPFRLAVRFARPDFFSRVNRIQIGDCVYDTYGNFHLLSSPFKVQVVVHRADSSDKKRRDRDLWLHTGANGGVLVSPFISEEERSVRIESEELGAKIILITHEAMPERFKPSGRDFGLCAEGRLLIVSLGMPVGTPLSRVLCLQMNGLAGKIASGEGVILR